MHPLRLGVAVLALGFATPAMASAPGCDGGEAVDIAKVLRHKDGAIAHLWGRENVSSVQDGARSVLRVAYPAGSFSPGQSPVRGGAGFEWRPRTKGGQTACLSYRVRFPEGFDFVKGGKLPGLFGGDDPRGCVADDKVSGFSARLMWRAEGAGELYLYAPGRDTRCGQSIGRGAWTFRPGAWTEIVERATVNTSGASDGAITVWVDGQEVVKAEGLALGAGPEATVDGLLFATFFGGGDASWATPRDQAVDFADVTVAIGPR